MKFVQSLCFLSLSLHKSIHKHQLLSLQVVYRFSCQGRFITGFGVSQFHTSGGENI